jgi:hypothetical protein
LPIKLLEPSYPKIFGGKVGLMLWGYHLMNHRYADLTAHFYTNNFDKAREAIFQEAIKAAKKEVESLI